MRVSVSIVTHQSAQHIASCLQGVYAQGSLVHEVLLVDNGSRDGTAERVRREYPDVRVLSLPHNTGFAAGQNRNIARAGGELVLALNPDVELGPGYLAEIASRFERDARLGAATGRILAGGDPTRIDSAGIAYDRMRTRFVDRGRGALAADYEREQEVFGVCAAAAVYRRAALEAVSRRAEAPFAERLFMYYEDVDLSWRLRRAGWRIRYCAGAGAHHLRGGSGASADFVEYHLVRNRLWVSLRNATPVEFARELPGLALFEGVKCVQAFRRPHLRAALADQLRGVRASLVERRRSAETV
jgi:GT2 family glycosyltransferase